MPWGTANAKLRKALLFKYIQLAGDDICFKCTKIIDDINTLSIEHKVNWRNKDNNLFWDLNNITFSHLKCNLPERKYPNGRPHGMREKYDYEACRCKLCRIARMKYQKMYRNNKK